MLWRGQNYLVLNKISTKFSTKNALRKKIYFSSQINLTIGERPNNKNIESLNLTRKVNLLRLWRGKIILTDVDQWDNYNAFSSKIDLSWFLLIVLHKLGCLKSFILN